MKISNNTNEITETNKFICEFCKRKFVKEKTLVSHICEYKQRWLNKDLKGNRLGFQAWLQFYNKTSMSKTKNKTHEEFIRNPYYIGFVKFGSYCSEVNVLNPSKYVDWLLRDNVKLDNWATDTIYTKYLCEYLRLEDPFDAIARTVQTTIDLSVEESINSHDYLRYGNTNKICYNITTGKISPWVLYNCESGVKFLDSLSSEQVKLILDYINPELWTILFKKNVETVNQVKNLLNKGGY